MTGPVKEPPGAREVAETRFRRLLERRNELNAQAKIAREERDAMQEARRRILADVQGLVEERRRFHEQLAVHKARRTEHQTRARQLLEIKKAKRAGASGGAQSRERELDVEIRMLERRHETTALPPAKENELLDTIRKQRTELAKMQAAAKAELQALGEVADLDGEITRGFAAADAEHAEVLRLHEEANKITERLAPYQEELDHLRAEADRKHQEYVDLRARADHYHARADEMRSTVVGLREDELRELREGMAAIEQQRREVEASLSDEQSLNQAADEVIALLKKRGKVEL
ncbi:MAG TPA: hypothetical protein VM681_05935 [Candidatus Thermoplasmatota archaeon]|nr:hypothetical protein [Candidatus Thermoplasmatota archaeon]